MTTSAKPTARAESSPRKPSSFPTLGYAAQSNTSPLEPFRFERRAPGPKDVQIDILYCGVCHSDLHTVRDEWGGTTYPAVPGHEIVGRVTARRRRGDQVQGRRPGRRRLPGRFLPALRDLQGGARAVLRDRASAAPTTAPTRSSAGSPTAATRRQIVVDEHFVLTVSPKLDPAGAAPLLCAGITTYSPLRHWTSAGRQKVGVVGLGGLGHMGVKLAHAFGRPRRALHHLARQEQDAHDARRRRGRRLPERRTRWPSTRNSFDFILNTVAASHDLDAFIDAAQARRHDGAWSARRSTRIPSPTVVQPDLQAHARSPAR